MIKKILLLSNTIKNLKASQVFGQIVRRLVGPSYIVEKRGTLSVEFVYFKSSHRQKGKYKGGNLFCFLNQEHRFYTINWDFLEYGKLWNYNLEYFDYLLQDDINNEEKLGLLYSFYEYCIENRRILEPYPVSLRVINIIKFFSIHKIFEDKILNYVTQELFFLSKNLEYHILGNHLLENAFALYLGGVFFNNREWQDKAQNILIKELGEQILEDGAHFELSPMYHNIVFFRVLELIDWYSNYKGRDEEFLCLCNDTASKMRSWIENIQFTNGDIPLSLIHI